MKFMKLRYLTFLATLFVYCIIPLSVSQHPNLIPSSSAIHSPIILSGNSEVDAFFNGNGTDGLIWETAYTLESLKIDGGEDFSAIDIRNTNRCILIENCTLKTTKPQVSSYDPDYSQQNGALVLVYCENISVVECIIQADLSQLGVGIGASSRISISNNHIMDCVRGLRIVLSDHISIEDNTYSNITGEAILALDSDYNTICYNTGTCNGLSAIWLDNSDNNEVAFNCFTGDNLHEMVLDDGQGNSIHDNTCRSDKIPSYPLLSLILISAISIAMIAMLKKNHGQ